MSSVGYAQGRRAREAAAKERRKKLFAFVGLGLLLVVLAIQVPKTLRMLQSESPLATSSAAAPATSTPSQSSVNKTSGKRPRFLRTTRADDPFAVRRVVDEETRPGSVGGRRDPFQRPSATTPRPAAPAPRLPRRIIVGTPGTRAPRIGYTVVLASIPTSNSRTSAVRFARTARARGVRNVGVLRSSAANRLRLGYWVVYSGMYGRSSGAQRAAAQVHARGYRTAYPRQLVRY